VQEVVTNSNGITSVYLVLGSTTDSVYTVEASAVGLTGIPLRGSPIIFHATAISPSEGLLPAADDTTVTLIGTISIVASEGQDTVGFAGKALVTPRVIQVTDQFGRGIPDVAVYWSVLQGGGSVTNPLTMTDANGLAFNFWTMGPKPGLNRLQAYFISATGEIKPVIFEVQALQNPDVRGSAYEIATVPAELDSLVATAGQVYPLPLVVAVTDTFGLGSPGQQVTFVVEQGGGELSNTTVTTNSEGIAQTTFTLGPNPGLNRVRASIIRTSGLIRSVVFDIWGQVEEVALTGPDSIAVISGAEQKGEVNSLLPLPLVLGVYDSTGAPVPGVDVTLTVIQGSGSIGTEASQPNATQLTITSNEQGLVVFTWQLGPGPDLDNTVVAQIRRSDGTLRSVNVHVEALPSPDTANRLVIISGDNQGYNGEYAVGTELPLPLVVRVVDTTRTGVGGDSLGAPIPNFPVLFQAFSPSADATVSASSGSGPGGTGRLESLTNEDGLAGVRLTLGTLTGGADDLNTLRNNNRVVAVAVFADGTQDSVIFFATAMPQSASSMAASGLTELSGTAGKSLPAQLSVIVTDQYGNVVSGVPVNFNAPAGVTLSQTTVYTDANGNASTSITQLSTKAEEIEVNATNANLSGSPVTFTITVNADEPAEFLLADGDGQSSAAGTAFTTALKVIVYDQYANPVPDVRVTFQVTSGSASVSPNAVNTDSDGAAEATVTPIAAGSITVTATVIINGTPTSVTFNLTAT